MKISKVWIRAFIATIAIVALLIIGWFYMVDIGNYLSGQIIKDLVKKETNGRYTLSYDSLHFNPEDKKIALKNLTLIPDTLQKSNGKEASHFYEIQVAHLNIALESILSIYLYKKLIIKGVSIMDPVIRMIKADTDKPVTLSFETGSLYELIRDYLQIFKIDYFKIQDGKLNYNISDSTQQKDYTVENLQFEVQNFLVDSILTRRKFFYSEAIELVITDQKILLPDSIHQLTFDRFILSTRDSLLTFQNLHMQPRPSTGYHVHGSRSPDLNIYNIKVPELQLRGIDYLSAYNDNHLKIENIKVASPEIFVDDETHTQKPKSGKKDNSLPKLLTSLFYAIDVNHFQLENANLDFKLSGQSKTQEFTSNRTDIELFNFHIDTSHYKFNRRELPFENIKLEIKDNTYNLTDSLHQLSLKSLVLNSKDSTLAIEDLHLYPYYFARDSMKAKINLHVPQLKILGINYLEAINDNFLKIKELNLQTPALMIYPPLLKSKNQPLNFAPSDLYAILKPYLHSLESNTFNVNSGRATIKNNLKIGAFDLKTASLNLDSGVHSWQNFSKGVQLDIRRVNKKITDGNIFMEKIATQGLKDFQLNGFTFNQNKENAAELAINIPESKIYGMHLDSLFFSEKIRLDSFDLTQPELNYQPGQKDGNKDKNFQEILKEINLIKGNISSGTIQFTTLRGDSLRINNINTTLAASSPINFQNISTGNINYFNPKSNYRISIADMEMDPVSKDLSLQNLSVDPIAPNDTPGFQAFIPSINIKNFNQDKLLRDSLISGKALHLQSPQISWTSEKSKNGQNEKAFQGNLSFDQMEISKGQFKWINNTGQHRKVWSGEAVNFESNNFRLPREKDSKNNFLSLGTDMELNAKNIRYLSENKSHANIGEVTFSIPDKSLQLNEILFSNKNESNRFTSDKVEIKNLEANRFLNEKILQAGLFNIENPNGHWTLGSSKSSSKQLKPLPLKELRLDHFQMGKGNFRLHQEEGNEPLHLKNVQVNITGLNLDPNSPVHGWPDQTNAMSISGQNISFPLDEDTLFQLAIGKYTYTYPGQDIQLEKVKLQPKYDKKAYNQKISHQEDWYKGNADTVSIRNFKLEEWITNNEILSDKVTISNGEFEIYRNKNLPPPENQHFPLFQKRLLSLGQVIHLDTINFSGDINYSELPEGRPEGRPESSPEPAQITFNNLNAHVQNFYTQKELSNQPLTIIADGKIMNEGDFSSFVRFDMNGPDYPFEFQGYIRQMDLTSLNPLIKPSANVLVKSGKGNSNDFQFRGNEDYAYGTMKFNYEDLRVTILNPATMDTQGLSQSIKTFFTNTFIIKKSNPKYFIPRKGNIYFERDSTKSVFNYWAKSILTGILSSVGGKSYKKEIKQIKKQSTGKKP